MKLLQIGASGRTEEVEVPGVGAAIGDWNSYTPAWTSYSNPQPALGNGSIGGRWRRVGDSLECCIFIRTGTTTTYGTDDWFFSIPSGISIDTNKALSPLGTGMLLDQGGGSPVLGTVQVYDSTKVCVTSVGNFKSTTVGWLSSGDIIMLRFTVPISSWSSNINLAQDFREYACNSSTTTTDDLTSFSSSPDGAFVKAFSPSGTNSVRKRVRFSSPLRHSDLLIVQISLTASGDDWIDYRDISWGMTTNSSGSEFYGMGLRRVPGSSTDVDVNFWSRPLIGSYFEWPSSDIYRWRVVRISNGNFAESGSDDYSTAETLTNKKWINGKPIYRKVINFGTLPNANSKSVAHGVTGITDFVSVRAFSGGTPIPFVGGSPTDTMSLWVDFTNFTIWCAGNKSYATAIGVMEYTK